MITIFKYVIDKSQQVKYLSNGFRRLAISIGFIISLIAFGFLISGELSSATFFQKIMFVFYVIGGVPLTLLIFNTIAWIIDGFRKDWGGKGGQNDE